MPGSASKLASMVHEASSPADTNLRPLLAPNKFQDRKRVSRRPVIILSCRFAAVWRYLTLEHLRRFAQCHVPGDVSTCHFSRVREGLIVALLFIGTLFGALVGAPLYDLPHPLNFSDAWHTRTEDFLDRRRAMQLECLIFCAGVVVQLTSKSE